MLGIRPCCLSHDYICPMTIWVFYQKKPLSPVIDRESRRGNASFRGLELLYLHIFRARFAQPSPWHSSQHLQGGGGGKPTMSCALHARSRNVPELCMGSSLKRRGKKRPYLLSYLIIPGGSSQLLPIWSIWLDWIHMFTGKKGSTSMFKHAHPSPNPLEAVGFREELLFNIPQHDLAFDRLWHNNRIFKRLGRSSSMIGWDLWL